VLHVDSCDLNQTVAVAQYRSNRTYCLFGPKGGAQQTHRVQILQPLTIGHIGLSSRDVLHVPGIDQKDLEPCRLKDLKEGNPIDSRRFHRDSFDAALLEPLSRCLKFGGEGAKAPDRLRIPVRRYCDIDLGRADINARGIGLQDVGSYRPGYFSLWFCRHGCSFSYSFHAGGSDCGS
jgi:hypothetical protein